MEKITIEKNEKTLEKLKDGYDRAWQTMFYGDKEKGIKPGNIFVYGAIVGQREVAMDRLLLRKKLQDEQGIELDTE